MDFILAHKVEVLAVLFALSELLAVSPLKSNSVFQLVYGLIKSVFGKPAVKAE